MHPPCQHGRDAHNCRECAEVRDTCTAITDYLQAHNFDTAGIDYEYRQQEVRYPGGSYTDRQLVAKRNGKTVSLDYRLAKDIPWVAAGDVMREIGEKRLEFTCVSNEGTQSSNFCQHGVLEHYCQECWDEWYRWLWSVKLALLAPAGDVEKEKK